MAEKFSPEDRPFWIESTGGIKRVDSDYFESDKKTIRQLFLLNMSRKNPSPAAILIMLPWQVGASLTVIAYVGLKWVLPAIGSDNKLLDVFIKAVAQNAWLAALFLGVPTVLSAILSAKKRRLLDAQCDIASMRELKWKEFEWLVGEAYRRQDYEVEESMSGGADGGIDLIIHKAGKTCLVQCKLWKVQAVGAPVIREQFGLLAHHKADKAIVITSGRFTREAIAFAEGKPIELIDGTKLIQLVKAVQNAEPSQPRPIVNEPTLTVPTPNTLNISCPSCGGTMIQRIAKKGPNAGNFFWGCSDFPKCRGVRNG